LSPRHFNQIGSSFGSFSAAKSPPWVFVHSHCFFSKPCLPVPNGKPVVHSQRGMLPAWHETSLRTGTRGGEEEGLTVSSLLPDPSLLNRKAVVEKWQFLGDSRQPLLPHFPVDCSCFFFSGVPVKLLTTDQSCQAFLCRERNLSGKKRAAVPDLPTMSHLVCLTSDHFQYLFNSVIHAIVQLSSSPMTLM